jgi:hypothetical protein
MAYLIEFRSERFDASAEPKNPVNPTFGHSVLQWLRARLKNEGIHATEPDHEDWGWYVDVSGFGSNYLVGAASVTDEEGLPGGPIDWVIQVHKHRRLSEKLLGRNRLEPDDPLCQLIESVVRAESSCHDVNASLEP